LQVVPLTDPERPRARELAASTIALVRAHVGLPRGALLDAWAEVAVAPSEMRLARALFKLALDTCEFDEGAAVDPVELRREIFTRSASLRRTCLGEFARTDLLQEIARSRGMEVDAIEEALYADLPTAHLLRKADLPSPEGLLSTYELAQHQAVLLRAVHLHARVFCASAAGYRALFRKLKFHRLLYTIEKLDRDTGYAIDVDGPFSLFEQTTKYGLKLALALPAILACDAWDVTADLRWGKDRRALRTHLRGGTAAPDGVPDADLPDEVAALLSDLGRQESPWQAATAGAILDLPGIGVCVPDLEFVHRETGQRVYLEVLGFWSRAAVWKRVEMVEAGLPHPIVFAVGKHLRVSEEVLGDDTPAALYVYARTMHARAVLERVEAVAGRQTPAENNHVPGRLCSMLPLDTHLKT
jgi:predicted nuclease of restriction endonuclease-like RecB superfamily